MSHIEGLYHLKHLEYFVIKKKPKDREIFKKTISKLCKYSPIKQITLLFQAKYKKCNHKSNYWQNLESINITHHPNLIMVQDKYIIPSDLSQFIEFSLYL